MRYCNISSGSKGNATLVFSGKTTILIDFGISKRRVENALKEFGLGFDDIDVFLLTHTHSDHASDIFNAPVEKIHCAVPKLPKVDHIFGDDELLKPYSKIQIGDFSVTPLPLSHDAENTVGFLLEDGEESLILATDTGFIPEKGFPYFKDRTYYLFESNHDAKMLYESNRPEYLIRRIISDTGHLSNVDSSYYLSQFIGPHTKEIVLSHLSDECNTPELALSTYENVMMTQLGYLPDVLVRCASDSHMTKGGTIQ